MLHLAQQIVKMVQLIKTNEQQLASEWIVFLNTLKDDWLCDVIARCFTTSVGTRIRHATW